MTQPLFTKTPDEVLDYTVDFTNWLRSGDSLVSADWTVPASLTKGTPDVTSFSTTNIIGGGTTGIYTVTVKISTLFSLVAERSFRIKIVDTK